MIDFATHPDQYRHWTLLVDGPVAELILDVDEEGGLKPGYALKLNSYDLGVDIELYDAVQRLRFEEDFGSGWVSEMDGRKPCFELIEEDPGDQGGAFPDDHGGEFPDDHGGGFPDDHGGEFPDEGGFPDEGALPDQEGDWPPEGELPPDEDGAKARSGMS